MTAYRLAGAAIVSCEKCGHEARLTWEAGDPPIFMPEHCDQPMRQLTHNDGQTPLEEPCPSHCCPRPHERL